MSDPDSQNDSGSEDESMNHEITVAPSLYQRPCFFRQTRQKGKIIKTVQERYLRDDLGFGCYFWDPKASSRRKGAEVTVGKPRTIDSVAQLLQLVTYKSGTVSSLIVCDTNVLLHNLDVLEQALKQVSHLTLVLPQTALQECRAKHAQLYDQAVELLRSVGGKTHQSGIFFPDQHHVDTQVEENSNTTTINDVQDARLRKVALYYGQHLKSHKDQVQVIFLTDDKDSRRKATQEQSTSSAYYKPLSVKQWVQQLEQEQSGLSLLDYVAHSHYTASTPATSSSSTKKQYFPPHLPALEVSRGVQAGTFHRGVYRSTDTYADKGQKQMGVVTIRRGDERVAITIPTWMDRNRAMEGDVVAVQLHPMDQWISLLAPNNSTNGSSSKKKETVGIGPETAEPTHSELSNVPDVMTVDDAAKSVRPTGKVVGILRRNTDLYSGSLWERGDDASDEAAELAHCEQEHSDGTATCIFLAVDPKLPPLLLRTTQRDRWLGQRLVVAMDSWPADSPFPLAHYTKSLGKIGDKAVETQVLLLQHHIPHEAFPAAVLACLPPADYDLAKDYSETKERDQRVDLRHLPILSIDPPGCTDIDDALHCFQMENGNYQVGVHIADVTHYVKAGTAIDLEAANRSTSTYLVDRRLDMLPSLLSTDLCSLKGNVDRFAFSVLWEVTPDAQIVKVDFQKTIIHSIAALTYQEAQTMIDLPDTPEHKKDKQVAAVKGLAHLARVFRKRRIDAGALTLASPEVKFVFDSESLNPTDVQAYAMLEANDLVMEFMLLANVTVGKKILRHYPTLSVLRRHPAPNRGRFDELISKAKSRGFDLVIDDSKLLADSLDAAVIESDPYFNKLLRICATRCLQPAQYFCSGEYRPTEWHHYGLAAPVYTHFTSPIRRYMRRLLWLCCDSIGPVV